MAISPSLVLREPNSTFFLLTATGSSLIIAFGTGKGPLPPNFSGGISEMADLIISKSRTKASVKDCNVSGDFYEALDAKVRCMIADAEKRAVANNRKTLKPQDL